jgi:hypothetical protein
MGDAVAHEARADDTDGFHERLPNVAQSDGFRYAQPILRVRGFGNAVTKSRRKPKVFWFFFSKKNRLLAFP